MSRFSAAFLALCLASVVLTPALASAAQAPAAAAVKKCRAGWVALTFDDGPSAALTPTLVKILLRKKVPATFFMVGERVASAPETARLVADSGFQIANHSYHHQNMTGQSNKAIARTLRMTKRALRQAGVEAPIKLMRPPYGATNKRVNRAVRRAGYRPVLWNADSLDWSGGSTELITRRVLRALSPGGSIVLQHDGITNSPNSIQAVPQIITKARKRGYCFTSLTRQGRLVVPKPTVSLRAFPGREGQDAAVGIRLSHPMPVATSVFVSTQDRTQPDAATSSADYQPRLERVEFPAGRTLRVLRFAATPDESDEADETFTVALSEPQGVLLDQRSVDVRIDDVRTPPRIAIDPATVTEPERGKAMARVRIRLGRASGKDITMALEATDLSAGERDFTAPPPTVTIPAGETSIVIEIPVRADRQKEGVEKFTVTILDASFGLILRRETSVRIVQPTTQETVSP